MRLASFLSSASSLLGEGDRPAKTGWWRGSLSRTSPEDVPPPCKSMVPLPERARGGLDEDGFTLVELMVVIVIIGLLATIVAVNVLPNLGKANVGKAKSDIAALEQGLEFYRLDNMTFPRTEQGLGALVSAPAGLAQPGRYRAGGYIKQLPDDPWGKPYEYANPGTHGGPFDIYSLGADGQPGGEDENADIGSWQ